MVKSVERVDDHVTAATVTYLQLVEPACRRGFPNNLTHTWTISSSPTFKLGMLTATPQHGTQHALMGLN